MNISKWYWITGSRQPCLSRGLDKTSIIVFQPQPFCEIPKSLPCWATCSLLATKVFLQVSAWLFCQVPSKVRCTFVHSLYSYSLSRDKLPLFCPAHRERKSSFDSACAISQFLVNSTSWPAFLSSCQSSRSLKSFFLTEVILPVMQQPLFELSFWFPNVVSNFHLLQERNAGHFHCWWHSLKKKVPENSQFSLFICFSLQVSLHFSFYLVVLTQFYVFLCLTVLLIPRQRLL